MMFYFRNFLTALGIVASVMTLLSSVNKYFTNYFSEYIFNGYFFLFFLCLLYTVIASRTKRNIKFKVSAKVNLEVKFGDLFEQKGIIVIPFNEYFDVVVDDKIISKNTLNGAFINKYFPNDSTSLLSKINEQLERHFEISNINTDRGKGNNKKYPLGTTIRIEKDDKIFFLVALTRFDERNRAQITNLEYQEVVIKLIDFIESNSNGYKVNLPLIGAGHSGVNANKQSLLEFLIFSLKIKDKLTLINGINIILDKDAHSEINLKLIDYYYKLLQ